MGMYLVALVIGVPCMLFVIFSYTPKGKAWRRQNNLL